MVLVPSFQSQKKKLAFWDWGAVFHTGLYGPVKMWHQKKQNKKNEAGGAPRLRKENGICCTVCGRLPKKITQDNLLLHHVPFDNLSLPTCVIFS
jgi:hypothetical protein